MSIAQATAEARRAAVQTLATASMARQENQGSKMGGPIQKQPMFNYRAEQKYEELQNFKLEVSNMSQNCNLGQRERVSGIKNSLGREGLQPIVTQIKEEQIMCMMRRAYLRPPIKIKKSSHSSVKQ